MSSQFFCNQVGDRTLGRDLNFLQRYVFVFSVFLVVFLDEYSGYFVHEHSINAVSNVIGGTTFDHVRINLIGISLRVGFSFY